MHATSEHYLKATLHLKKGAEGDFAGCMDRLLPIVRRELKWELLSALTDNNHEAGHTILHLWRIPDPNALQHEEEKLGGMKLYQEIMTYVADAKVELLTPTPYHAPRPTAAMADEAIDHTGVTDNDILIAADDGQIYRVMERVWHQAGKLLPEDQAKPIRDKLLANGVLVADIPQENGGGFAAICYLLNIKALGPGNGNNG